MFRSQWVTSTRARVRPVISVVAPRTSSWWAWWAMERSKGDLRSLMVRMNTRPRNTRGCQTTSDIDAVEEGVDLEGAGGQVEADGHEEDHGLVAEHLQETSRWAPSTWA